VVRGREVFVVVERAGRAALRVLAPHRRTSLVLWSPRAVVRTLASGGRAVRRCPCRPRPRPTAAACCRARCCSGCLGVERPSQPGGVERVGRQSGYAMPPVWRCAGRDAGGSSDPPEPPLPSDEPPARASGRGGAEPRQLHGEKLWVAGVAVA
jgi:hypothetical protein